MRIRNWITRRLCLVAAFTLFVGASLAQVPSPAKGQITAAINPAQRKIIGNSVHPLASAANDRGRADSSLAMKDMLLLLQPTQAQSSALKQFVTDLHNPNSPNFHKWLTPEQYSEQYGVGSGDIKIVSDWLTSNGFTVEQIARGKNWIRFSGTSSQVENAFQTTIHAYSVNGQTRYANASSLSIPAALAPAVAGVVRVNNFLSSAQHVAPATMSRDKNGKFVRNTNDATPTLPGSKVASPAFTSAGDQISTYLMPGDFAKIYNSQSVVASGIDGTGVSIAIVGRSDINLSDVEAFRTIAGLPFNDPNIIYASTDPGDISGDDFEASLDVEWAGAIAPKASINYVIGASTSATDGVDVAASYIVDNTTSPIMTVSFGLCEADMSDTQVNFYHVLWQQAASEGISVFVSSGDAGASGCNNPGSPSTVYGYGVNGLASTPYNVAVGGTEFNDADLNTYWSLSNTANLTSAKGYIPEAVWNESCTQNVVPGPTNCNFPPYYLYSYAGGGGASSCATRTTDDDGVEYCAAGYPKPSWQSGIGVPQDGVRDIPDVSLAAASEHVPYVLCYQGSCQWTTNSDGSIVLQQASLVGGTSAASPSMASIMALVEQKNGQFQGQPNYQLYKLAAQKGTSCDSTMRTDPTEGSACVFNDVTAGSNAVPCFSGNSDCQGDEQPVAVGVSLPPAIFYPDSQMDGRLATSGYDLGSGLGSVDVANLIAAWGNQSTIESATTLTLSKSTFTHGSSIDLNGTVTAVSGSGTPTGEVLLTTSGSTAVLSTPLTAGAFKTTSVDIPGGTYTLTAKYSGDSNFAASASLPVSVTVAPEASSLTGTTFAYSRFVILGQHRIVQLDNTTLGNSFWVQFQVAGTSGSTAATGTIKLTQAGKSLGTYPLNDDGLIYVQCGPETQCDLPIGSYTIQADYSGDSSFKPSTSTVPFTVTQGKAYSSTTANILTPVAGTKVIGYVYFTGDPGMPPTGTATLTRDDTGALLGSAKIDSTGTATIPFIATTGDFNLIAGYSGDSNYTYGGAKSYQEIVTQDNGGSKKLTIGLSLGATTYSMGQRSAYTVTLTPANGATGTPVGFITLYSGNGQIAAQIEPLGGKASGVIEWDQVGLQGVYAVYSGDGNFAGVSSGTTNVTVTQAVPVITVQPIATTVAVGDRTSISALLTSTVSSTNVLSPTGTVQFLDSVDGKPATQIGKVTPSLATGNGGTILATIAAALPQGSNVITAVYSGDANWRRVTSAPSTAIVVTTPSFTDAATPNPLTVTAGETASIAVSTQSILGYNAPIALSCGTLPEGVSCGSTTVNPGTTGTIILTTTAPGVTNATSANAAGHDNSLLRASGTIAFAGLFLICIPNRKRFHHLSIVLMGIGIIGGLIGCGGSGVRSTTLVLSSSNTKAASGSSITLEATVSSTNNATGSVTFFDGTTSLGSAVPAKSGIATLAVTSLPVGTHAITAKFSGDKHDSASSSSNTIEQTVTGDFTLTINATSGTLSRSLTVPATLN